MGKVARKARAAGAPRGTVAADPRIKIYDKPEKAANVTYSDDVGESKYVSLLGAFRVEELEVMPVRIINASKSRVQVWRGPDGVWYRCGAFVRVAPLKSGDGHGFTIVLPKGANRVDLDVAFRTVAKARKGDPGRRWQKRGTDWAPWADDRTFTYAFTSRVYADPYTHEDPAPRVSACTEPKCRDRWHEEYGSHVVDEVHRELPERRGSYDIKVTRLDGEPWTVDVYADEFYGTPEDVTTFVQDLQWMQEECRRANLPNEAVGVSDAIGDNFVSPACAAVLAGAA